VDGSHSCTGTPVKSARDDTLGRAPFGKHVAGLIAADHMTPNPMLLTLSPGLGAATSRSC